jgi:hypothetical protein
MSSTNRGGQRQPSDYYVTPIAPIATFLHHFHNTTKFNPHIILDPCAGGDEDNQMSYPEAIRGSGLWPEANIFTMDIRDDSKADIKGDYLTFEFSPTPALIISNPPFSHAAEFVTKALKDVCQGGYVIMLQRLNFLGGELRRKFWQTQLPSWIFVHTNRMGFATKKSYDLEAQQKIAEGKTPKPWKPGQTDSIEYAHYVWQKGVTPDYGKIRLI